MTSLTAKPQSLDRLVKKKSRGVELLAPAGDFEKLKTALSYGADAVYLGGEAFGLRSAAGNFSLNEIEKAVAFAHKLKRKVYLTLNTFPNNHEIDETAQYIKCLKDIALDAVIVADPGVFALVRELTDFHLHLSTQASVTHVEAVKFWVKQGVSRIVLGREVSIDEVKAIKEQCDIELEMFIHGSMCMSYSGKCTISNYTANRDANRGGCVNSCRWDYSLSTLTDKESFTQSYIMNSKDLWAVDSVPGMIAGGVDSLKLEGRMKSHLYLATTISIYRQILDLCLEKREIEQPDRLRWVNQLNSIPSRGFSNGFLEGLAGRDSILYDNVKPNGKSNYIGVVKEVGNDFILLQVKNRFFAGDSIKFLTFAGEELVVQVDEIKDISREPISEAKPNSLVFLQKVSGIGAYNVALY